MPWRLSSRGASDRAACADPRAAGHHSFEGSPTMNDGTFPRIHEPASSLWGSSGPADPTVRTVQRPPDRSRKRPIPRTTRSENKIVEVVPFRAQVVPFGRTTDDGSARSVQGGHAVAPPSAHRQGALLGVRHGTVRAP